MSREVDRGKRPILDRMRRAAYTVEQYGKEHPVGAMIVIGAAGLHLSAQFDTTVTNPNSELHTLLVDAEAQLEQALPQAATVFERDIRYLAELLGNTVRLEGIDGPVMPLLAEMTNRTAALALLVGGGAATAIRKISGENYREKKMRGDIPASRILPVSEVLIADPTVAGWYLNCHPNIGHGGTIYINPNPSIEDNPVPPSVKKQCDYVYRCDITKFDQVYPGKKNRLAVDQMGVTRARMLTVLNQNPKDLLYGNPESMHPTPEQMRIMLTDLHHLAPNFLSGLRLRVSHPHTGYYSDQRENRGEDSIDMFAFKASSHGIIFKSISPEEKFRRVMHTAAIAHIPDPELHEASIIILDTSTQNRPEIERMADGLRGNDTHLNHRIDAEIVREVNDDLYGHELIVVYGKSDEETLQQTEAILARNWYHAQITRPVLRNPEYRDTCIKMGANPFVVVENMK